MRTAHLEDQITILKRKNKEVNDQMTKLKSELKMQENNCAELEIELKNKMEKKKNSSSLRRSDTTPDSMRNIPRNDGDQIKHLED